MSHPIDAHVNTDRVTLDVLLAPVRCIDCDEYVPFGWVEYGTVRCAKNIGATGVQYGHRVTRDVYDGVKDSVYNNVLPEEAKAGDAR